MEILFIGRGIGAWQAYGIIWACLFLSLLVRHGMLRSFAKATGITTVLYFSPCLTFLGFCVWFYLGVSRWHEMNQPRRGVVTFSHDYFGDAQTKALHNGFTYEEGASSWGIASNDVRVPKELATAARTAVRIDPWRGPDGSVVLQTTVEMEGGKPVTYDHVVTRRQIERYDATGIWDEPETVQYKGVTLSAPTGIAAAFMSYFNGPKTKRVKRGGG